jgi:hypothetical protein
MEKVKMSRVFDLGFKEESVTLRGSDGEHVAVLREMNGHQREDYLDALQQQINITVSLDSKNNNNPTIKSMKGLTSLLLCNCMSWIGEDGTLTPVTDKELMSFPSRVLTTLSELANEINGFTVPSAEAAIKN